jgi:hypothetical protein
MKCGGCLLVGCKECEALGKLTENDDWWAFPIGEKMLYLEADSIAPILELFQAQIDSPVPTVIEVGRKGPLFTIRINLKSTPSSPTAAGIPLQAQCPR